ncbi:MAG: toxic anion resistance protein, partial [Anaerococcus sp.]|nr:toxic anion resistance protein [Anaerococcus sp.]
MSDIKLTLDGADENDSKLDNITNETPDLVENNVKFSPEEEKMIDDFSKKIKLDDTNIILQYGS